MESDGAAPPPPLDAKVAHGEAPMESDGADQTQGYAKGRRLGATGGGGPAADAVGGSAAPPLLPRAPPPPLDAKVAHGEAPMESDGAIQPQGDANGRRLGPSGGNPPAPGNTLQVAQGAGPMTQVRLNCGIFNANICSPNVQLAHTNTSVDDDEFDQDGVISHPRLQQRPRESSLVQLVTSAKETAAPTAPSTTTPTPPSTQLVHPPLGTPSPGPPLPSETPRASTTTTIQQPQPAGGPGTPPAPGNALQVVHGAGPGVQVRIANVNPYTDP